MRSLTIGRHTSRTRAIGAMKVKFTQCRWSPRRAEPPYSRDAGRYRGRRVGPRPRIRLSEQFPPVRPQEPARRRVVLKHVELEGRPQGLRRTGGMWSISCVRLNGPVLKLALERHADEIRDRVL